jgi:hypothetical protein
MRRQDTAGNTMGDDRPGAVRPAAAMASLPIP